LSPFLFQEKNSLSQEQETAPFDMIFIDADKPNNPNYLNLSLQLVRQGSLIVADNIIRRGEVVESHSVDANVEGVRQFNQLVADNPNLDMTAFQTVGSKGYDGWGLIHVKAV
jgi:predicted O-methyltransferase YrrM